MNPNRTLFCDMDIELLKVCVCGSNLPCLFFCCKYPETCKRRVDSVGNSAVYIEQIIYCMACSSSEDTCHNHRQVMINQKCLELHRLFNLFYNDLQDL